ncbi:MAG: hypothetical protein AB8I08_10370 [Sandaracinaceae bacterium]
MNRALFVLACSVAFSACVATETGNPPFTVEEESFVVMQVALPGPDDPVTTFIDAPAGTVTPAAGQVEVRLLDDDAPTLTSPVAANGSFSISFDERGGERFRVLVRDGRDASAPIDAVAGFDGLTALPRTACLMIQPVVDLETDTVVVQNDCAFEVTRAPATWRLPTSASIAEGPLELGPGDAAEITITGLNADNTLRIELTAPNEELRAVTFLAAE